MKPHNKSIMWLGIFGMFIIASMLFAVQPAMAYKRHVGSNTIQLYDKGGFLGLTKQPKFDITLEHNSGQCLMNCHATLKLHAYNTFHVNRDRDIGFKFKDRRGRMLPPPPTLKDYQYYIKVKKPYTKNVPVYGKCTRFVKDNQTGQETKQSYRCVKRYKKMPAVKEVWEPFPDHFVFVKGKDYYIKLAGVKKPNTDVDWIFSLTGEDVEEWAWWDTNWQYKQELSNLTGNISLIHINYDSGMRTDFGDLRFLNSTETGELNYTIEKYVASDYALVRVANLNDTSIWMYFGNSGATTTSNVSNVYFSPLALYYLDEASGTTAENTMGSYNGTTTATVGYAGWMNYSEYFGGSTSYYIDIPDSGALSFNNNIENYTVMGRFKTDSLDGVRQTIIIDRNTTSNPASSYHCFIETDNTTECTTWDTSSGETLVSSTKSTVGVWSQFTLVSNTTNMMLYINGIQESITSISSGDTSNGEGTSIGRFAGTAYSHPFNGTIDEMIIWNKALSPNEVNILSGQNEPNVVFGGIQSISLILNIDSPLNQTYWTNNITLNFTVSGNQSAYPCWRGIDTSNMTYVGNITNNTAYVEYMDLGVGSHYVNVTCENEETVKNFTVVRYFSVDDFKEINSSASEGLIETQTSSYSSTANVSWDILDEVNAYLVLNGTQYLASRSTSGNQIIFNKDVVLPFINNNVENLTYYWNYSKKLKNGTIIYEKGSDYNQTVYKMIIAGCNATYTTQTLHLEMRNETNNASISGTISMTGTIWYQDSSKTRTYNIENSSSSFLDVCIYPNWASYKLTADVDYQPSDTVNYTKREYDINWLGINNVSQTFYLYTTLAGSVTDIVAHVTNEDGDEIPDVLIEAYKYNVGSGYQLVEGVTTGGDGTAVMKLDINYEYDFKLYYKGSLVHDSGKMRITSSDVYFQINIQSYNAFSTWSAIKNMSVQLTYNNATKNFEMLWVDSSNLLSSICLSVKREYFINESETIGVQCSTDSSGTITIHLSNDTGLYIAQAYGVSSSDGNTYPIKQLILDNRGFSDVFGSGGLFVAMLFVGIAGFLGLINPIAAIIFTIVALIMSAVLGLMYLGVGAIIGLVLVGIILIIKLNT